MILTPLVAHGFLVQVDVGIDGGLHLSVAQALLDVAGIPTGFDELSGMGVPEHMGMHKDAALLAVVAKQAFDRFTSERVSVGHGPPVVLRVALEDHKKVIGLEGMLLQQVVQQRHELWGKIDEALLAFAQTLGESAIFQP